MSAVGAIAQNPFLRFNEVKRAQVPYVPPVSREKPGFDQHPVKGVAALPDSQGTYTNFAMAQMLECDFTGSGNSYHQPHKGDPALLRYIEKQLIRHHLTPRHLLVF